MPGTHIDLLGPSDDQSGLRPAEQLVSREAHHGRPRAHRPTDRRFVCQRPEVLEKDTGPDVVDHRHVELAERLNRYLGDEPDRPEI